MKSRAVKSLIQDKNLSVHFQEEINLYMTSTILKYSSIRIPLGKKRTDGIIKSQLIGSSCVTLTNVLCGKEISILFCPIHGSLTR